MIELAGRLGAWIVDYLVIASVLAAVIVPLTYMAARFGLLRGPVHRHLLWSCCLMAIAVLPAIRMQGWRPALAILPPPMPTASVAIAPEVAPRPSPMIVPAIEDDARNIIAAEIAAPLPARPHAAVADPPAAPAAKPVLTWQAVVALVYLGGVMVFVVRLAVAWRRLARLLRSAVPAPAELSDRLGVASRRVRLMISGQLAAPVCLGIARPAILLPRALVEIGRHRELAMVMAHELAHVQRRDCLVNLLQRLFEAVFFFHPLAWVASRQLTQAREQVCDNHVLMKGASAMDYANLLCQTIEQSPKPAISAVALFEGGIVHRLRNLKAAAQAPLTRLGRLRRIGWTTCVLAIFASLATVRLEARAATPPTSSPHMVVLSAPASLPASTRSAAVDFDMSNATAPSPADLVADATPYTSSQTFSILGAVARPGQYNLQPGTTLLKALALAGGATQTDLLGIYVIRAALPQESATRKTANSSPATLPSKRVIGIDTAKLYKGDPAMDIAVRPDDIIMLPLSLPGEFYVMGEVRRSGVYSLTGRHVTVRMALAAAGQIEGKDWPEKGTLIRRSGQSEETFIPLNIKAILAGQENDSFLEPNDVLVVGPTSAASGINVPIGPAAIQSANGLRGKLEAAYVEKVMELALAKQELTDLMAKAKEPGEFENDPRVRQEVDADPILRAMILEEKTEAVNLDAKTREYGPDHADVRKAGERLIVLRKDLRDTTDQVVGNAVRGLLDKATRRPREIQAQIDAIRDEMAKIKAPASTRPSR